jgi:hypothetical protein
LSTGKPSVVMPGLVPGIHDKALRRGWPELAGHDG